MAFVGFKRQVVVLAILFTVTEVGLVMQDDKTDKRKIFIGGAVFLKMRE